MIEEQKTYFRYKVCIKKRLMGSADPHKGWGIRTDLTGNGEILIDYDEFIQGEMVMEVVHGDTVITRKKMVLGDGNYNWE